MSEIPFYRQPLLHFLLMGGVIFTLHATIANPDQQTQNIVVSPAQIQRMSELWSKTWGRQPGDSELQGLIQEHIKEEVYYREALKLGLDNNDIVIRRRLRQKMEFIVTPESLFESPSEQQLQDYLDSHAEQFSRSATFSYEQIYFGSEQTVELTQALQQLRRGAEPSEVRQLGQQISLPSGQNDVADWQISKIFGSQFYAALNGLASGQWDGPIKSGFGLHLVKITHKQQPAAPTLNEVRKDVSGRWADQQRKLTQQQALSAMLENYTVQIDAPAAKQQ
jgi:peptidyl-prolyl cis-trans isomerase C